ncbi:unnamed protein product [Tetraodon nigroviridis]|uniref:(spotted green pufferfish) hypothetical protein n=1 Tax=Tetraodon nigroviridis TaxID=99883 RepID=Q4S5P1_TETNG|nr:unnamed protein product [Tetraodon nigroviridis]
MGKEQELLEAARTGNLAAVEKLLSGKRQTAAIGSGFSGTGGSGISSGHGASSHPLSSLLRWVRDRGEKWWLRPPNLGSSIHCPK